MTINQAIAYAAATAATWLMPPRQRADNAAALALWHWCGRDVHAPVERAPGERWQAAVRRVAREASPAHDETRAWYDTSAELY